MKHWRRKKIAAALVVLIALPIAYAAWQRQATRARRVATSTGGDVTVRQGDDLQRALNGAKPGDEVVLEAGATFTGNFKLPAKTGAGFITVRSSRCAELPEGKRVDPSQANLMARLATPNVAPALLAPPGSHHWQFRCLEFTQAAAVDKPGYNLIQLGDGDSAGPQNTLESVPHHFEFDRVIVRARDERTGVQRGISVNSASTSITNSYIAGMKWEGVEAQAIAGWNGPGPFLIENNYLEAAGINVLFGGAKPAIPNLVPSDITVRGNYIFKPLSWRIGDKSYAGIPWTVKNLLELKNARRVVIEENVMENSWPHAQVGWAVIFNAFHDAEWTAIEDVRFIRNRIKNVTSGINLRGMDDGDTQPRMKRVVIADNVIENLGAYGSSPRAFQMLLGSEDVSIDHNTVIGVVSSALMFDGPPSGHVRFAFTNNLLPHGEYGVFGSGGTLGTEAVNRFAVQWTMTKNAFIGTPEDLKRKYAGNYFPSVSEKTAVLKGTDNQPVGARASETLPTSPTRSNE